MWSQFSAALPWVMEIEPRSTSLHRASAVTHCAVSVVPLKVVFVCGRLMQPRLDQTMNSLELTLPPLPLNTFFVYYLFEAGSHSG